MPDATVHFPSPYPVRSGAGAPRLWARDGELFITFPEMAMDAMPRTAIAGASGGRGARDQDPDDGTTIAESPQQAAFAKLFEFLSDHLSPEAVQEASTLVQQLFAETDDSGNGGNGNGNAVVGDARPRTGYSQHFPHAGRLYRGTYR